MLKSEILEDALTEAHVRSRTDWYSFLKNVMIPFSLKRVKPLLTIQVTKSSEVSVSLLSCSSFDQRG